MPMLLPRYYTECRDQYGRYYNCSSRWNDWVRWVVLAVVVIGFFLLFVMCSCLTARRRRKAGRQPFYGTGWASRPGGNAQPYYNNNNYSQPPPQYTPQPQQGSHYGTGVNQGYYGNNGQQPYPYGQANGVELQQPQQSHLARGGEDVYSPPPGPPPTKGDGIIR
ncbi:hypothetical protein PMIN06_007500 [Paraphaeosphaeria minitans]|uniref:Chitin synthesis regulation, resistance to congo red-domain-containing protein n=1 Tax=Paraphaeosphaeria minitans TaxID=565426 RepID=A0A9P6KN75_9PLEO|nr:hypothetical protein PMIN01_08981 [Paraphaeosphaeria minitans]